MKKERSSAAFKRKVALEAIREKTLNEIASAFDIHPVQVGRWKKQLLEGIDNIFESSSKGLKEQRQISPANYGCRLLKHCARYDRRFFWHGTDRKSRKRRR